jgi:NADH-ubiquinone oxidoreductase chain 1
MIFFISSVAETNRAPFDLAEAESELVSGFMTEHAAGIFVFFFLAEYASIILMCMLISIVLLGGYEIFSIIYLLHLPFVYIIDVTNYIIYLISHTGSFNESLALDSFSASNTLFIEYILNNNLLSFLYSSSLSYKTYAMVFLFILVRASYPRLRFDRLMAYC